MRISLQSRACAAEPLCITCNETAREFPLSIDTCYSDRAFQRRVKNMSILIEPCMAHSCFARYKKRDVQAFVVVCGLTLHNPVCYAVSLRLSGRSCQTLLHNYVLDFGGLFDKLL